MPFPAKYRKSAHRRERTPFLGVGPSYESDEMTSGHFVALSVQIQIVKSPNRLMWRPMWYVFVTDWGSDWEALRRFANKRYIKNGCFERGPG